MPFKTSCKILKDNEGNNFTLAQGTRDIRVFRIDPQVVHIKR